MGKNKRMSLYSTTKLKFNRQNIVMVQEFTDLRQEVRVETYRHSEPRVKWTKGRNLGGSKHVGQGQLVVRTEYKPLLFHYKCM